MRRVVCVTALVGLAGSGLTAGPSFLTAGASAKVVSSDSRGGGATRTAVDEQLPPSSDRALAAIGKSPRHGEWVSVERSGATPIKTWVVYPERSDKAPVVIVIHANTGLTDWARAVADQLAEDGYIAVAPDLLSGLGPNGGDTESIGGPDAARKAISTLTRTEVVNRLHSVREYALEIPAANGRIATMGFCWGGARSFEYAVDQPALDAAIVFYGTSPSDPAAYARVRAPVLGLYAGDDPRVNATIEPAVAEMKKAGKVYEYEIYDGAGHGFLGSHGDRDGANYRASQKAWPRALQFLRKYLN